MNYESLQLVNYEGEMIPGGFLLGEVSADFSINYLKSLGSPESAIDKIKDVEVSKLLYDVYEILKAAEPDEGSLFSGYTFTSPEGKQFGAGTENPRVPGNVIHALKDQGRLPKDWSMSAGDKDASSPAETQEYLQTPVYVYKDRQTKDWMYTTTKPKGKPTHTSTIGEIYQLMHSENGKKRLELSQTKVNKKNKSRSEKVCSMEYDSQSGIIKIDVLGNLPNIWANLVTAIGSFDPKQKDSLNATFETKVKSSAPFNIDASVIPLEIRDQVMDKVMDPNVHFTEIIDTLNTLTSSSVVSDIETVGNGLSETLSVAMGINMSNALYGMLDSQVFINMVNTGIIPKNTIDTMFPLLKQAFDNNTDENGMIDPDMEITKNMLLVNIDGSPDTVKAKMESIMEGMHSLYVGGTSLLKYPKHIQSDANANYHTYMREIETLFAPVLNIVLTETTNNAVQILLPLCTADFPTESIKLKAIEDMVKAIKSQKKPLSLYANRDYKTDTTDFFKAMNGVTLSVESDAALGVILKELSLRVLDPTDDDPIMSKYGAIRQNEGFKRIDHDKPAFHTITAFSPRIAPNPSALENQRDSNILAGMLISSISAFGSKARESDWISGMEHIDKSIASLNDFLDKPLTASDFIPFAKAPPVMQQSGNPPRITYVDSNNKIHVHNLVKDSEESKIFAEMVAEDMRKLLGDYLMDSGRSTACGILARKPELASIMTIERPNKEFFSPTTLAIQSQVSHMLSSFSRGLMDPSMGNKRITCLTGGISASAELRVSIGKLVDKKPEIVQGVLTNPPSTLEEELALRESIASVIKKKGDADKIFKVLVNSVLYDNTMRVLDKPELVRELLATGTIAQTPPFMSEFMFGKIKESLKHFNPADFDFTQHITDKENAVEKAQVVTDALVHYITQSAKAEYIRRKILLSRSPREFGSAKRHSDSFEALSSIGHLVSEINQRKGKVVLSTAPRDPDTYETELTLEFEDGTNFTTGLRKSPPNVKGGAIDMVGTSFQPNTSTLTIDPLELKISQDTEKFADLNATNQVNETYLQMIENKNPQRLIIRGTINSNVLYANSEGVGPKRGFFTELQHDMSIRGSTEFGADGNIGVGKPKYV